MTTEETTEDEVSPVDTMTLTEHLAELRVRIIRSALAVAIGMVLIIAFYDQVLDFLLEPYVELCERKPQDFCDPDLFVFSPTEGLATRVRVGLYGGLIATGAGWGLVAASPLTLLLAGVLALFFQLKSGREEIWLGERYPDYAAYATRTKRFFPYLY